MLTFYSTLRPYFLPALLWVLLSLALPARAATLNVPTTAYPTIQAAITASQNGDTVLVADGTYSGEGNRDIDFGGKNITVTSQHGAAATIIDCGGSSSANHRGFFLHSGETNVAISGLTIENGYEGVNHSGFGGGAICLETVVGGTITITDCTFTANTAYDLGGAIFVEGGINAVVGDCTFEGNEVLTSNGSAATGGAICDWGTLTLARSMFIGNSAQGCGGGVYIGAVDPGASTVTDCTVIGNSAGSGGGIFNDSRNASIAVSNCTITDNSASDGGGISNESSANYPFSVTNCLISRNTASYSGGGGIENYDEGQSTMIIANCTLSANTARTDAGGIMNYSLYGGPLAMTDCTVTGNTAQTGNGGGIVNLSADYGGPVIVTNCTVTNNAAPHGMGGGIYDHISDFVSNDYDCSIRVTNCSVTANTAAGGSGIYSNSDSGTYYYPLVLSNNIVYGNLGSEVGGSWFTIFYCDIQGGLVGTSNIDADPLFVNAASGDLHLQPSSPCLGAGTSSGVPPADKDGNARPTAPSMGAYDAGDLILLSVPSSVPGGTVVTATVTLSGPAPVATVIGLSSSDSSVIRLFRAVTVPAGSSSATFTINTYRSHTTKTVTIQAALGQAVQTQGLTIKGR